MSETPLFDDMADQYLELILKVVFILDLTEDWGLM
jgi:hypothetical protein